MKLSKGFTLIELIISVFILSVAVVGIFNAFSIMIILTSDAADRLTATYLAQEGEEIWMLVILPRPLLTAQPHGLMGLLRTD
jgi:prepilin-type N-terminal cleavage/methylation domain-containing protein